MRDWNLKTGDPRSLILAADARFCTPDYYDDQIWELKLGGGDPPAVSLQTTFGLRARNFRIFPIFTQGEVSLSNPEDFAEPPHILRFYPNFLTIHFNPFVELAAVMEFWAAQSQAVAGRIRLSNRGSSPRQVKLELAGLLMAAVGGTPMAPSEIQAAPVLSGRTADLAPVLFMTGGASATSGSYPTLTLQMDLLPGGFHQVSWCHAALKSEVDSFNLARSIAAHNWDAEYARIEMVNQGQVEVHSGDIDWDTAFAITQKVAYSLITGPTENLPFPSFVQVRNPDQGYSLVGDGSDYGPIWNGQSAFDAYALANLILPASPDLVRGLLLNFLATQDEEGVIDWKPGLGGQKGNRQAAPLLVNLAWLIYQFTQDHAFLEEVFPQLLKFIQAWFTPQRDRDQDGIPEWDNPMQAGFEDHPLFSRWYSWSKGIDITTTESPVLCALLFREIQNMVQMAQLIGRSDTIPVLESFSDNLRSAVEASWNHATNSYHYWDRDTHATPSGLKLGERQGPGQIIINQTFDKPVRLVFHLHVQRHSTHQARIFI
ncbi:MAG: MGH1-like glycoside hydrolase domain-containing protein, partial [Anaerolineales bacterium]